MILVSAFALISVNSQRKGFKQLLLTESILQLESANAEELRYIVQRLKSNHSTVIQDSLVQIHGYLDEIRATTDRICYKLENNNFDAQFAELNRQLDLLFPPFSFFQHIVKPFVGGIVLGLAYDSFLKPLLQVAVQWIDQMVLSLGKKYIAILFIQHLHLCLVMVALFSSFCD